MNTTGKPPCATLSMTALTISRWHSDIKPDNILNVDDTGTGVCKFKLADPGFAQFEPKAKHNDIPKLKLWGGTKTYGRSFLYSWRHSYNYLISH